MEAIVRLLSATPRTPFPIRPAPRRTSPFRSSSRVALVILSSASSQKAYKGPRPRRDLVGDWVASNDGLVRSLPIYVGGLSLLVVLFNRTFSGIAFVTDASSSQSRADILTLSLAVTNVLAGLVWLSIRPKYISPVAPCGVECRRINSEIADFAINELQWAWESFSSVTCCRSLVVIYGDDCLLQIGVASESPNDCTVAMTVDVHNFLQGSLCRSAMGSGKQSYLANLSLYPGRSELPFLPSNTQSIILQPLGDRGIAIIGGDTIRGFSNLDQAWITLIAEKLDSTLSKS
ncbi:protein COFACTOR ASSEMBLY OF COMPLEX C SUBUNIT B CCB4, chloroplastic [Canna indica]|uniref:Protein COFACTOR ASSEMBLY OF COMPLEX C SUBUNIT B CCB4, chloroplastic n=1 Tax=Canna indica TaxID=4628 RepID=A0AAQ3L6M1_9LILI|nr:protein COFACTOR ASSEMBLY OF COMPLEX C SUBUNIT B CCB4, chloroplastic [Canna indica]